MIDWIILGVYVVGYAWCFPRFVWVAAQDSYGDVAFGLVVGGLCCFLWPVIAPGYMLYHRGYIAAMMIPPRHVRKAAELRRQAAELEEREYRSRKMERELGVGQ